MNQQRFARQQRQLSHLVKQWQKLRTAQPDAAILEVLVRKIRTLASRLAGVLPGSQLRRVLGAAAVLIGFSASAQTPTFDAPVVNPFGTDSSYVFASPAVADIDDDGDLDLLVGEYYGVMRFFENTGTNQSPSFATAVDNPFGLVSTYYGAFPEFADLDDDGDLDLLVGEYYGVFQYFENTGTKSAPAFATPVANPFGLDSVSLYALPAMVDLDDDGDLDLLAGEVGGAMHYFENIGTKSAPAFAAPVVNPFGLDSTNLISIPEFADLDGDGDFDLLVGAYPGIMNYFQNTGTKSAPAFAAPVVNPFGLVSVYSLALPEFADMDGDGDLDLFVGDAYGVLNYFEDTTALPSSVPQLGDAVDVRVYPNPVTDVIQVQTAEQLAGIELMNLQGQTLRVIPGQRRAIPVAHLSPGQYILRFTTVDERQHTLRFTRQ